VLSVLMAFYHSIVFVKVWEKQRFADVSVDPETLTSEATKSYLEGLHWAKQTGRVHLSVLRRLLIKLVSV